MKVTVITAPVARDAAHPHLVVQLWPRVVHRVSMNGVMTPVTLPVMLRHPARAVSCYAYECSLDHRSRADFGAVLLPSDASKTRCCFRLSTAMAFTGSTRTRSTSCWSMEFRWAQRRVIGFAGTASDDRSPGASEDVVDRTSSTPVLPASRGRCPPARVQGRSNAAGLRPEPVNES